MSIQVQVFWLGLQYGPVLAPKLIDKRKQGGQRRKQGRREHRRSRRRAQLYIYKFAIKRPWNRQKVVAAVGVAEATIGVVVVVAIVVIKVVVTVITVVIVAVRGVVAAAVIVMAALLAAVISIEIVPI